MQSSARRRIRDEVTGEIKRTARRQLAEQGSAALSLRAVARELGMVSSAIYRYFPSRNELLTALIADACDAMGSTVEAAESAVRRRNLQGRWLAVARASRAWALARPEEYALIFGATVPGVRTAAGTSRSVGQIPLLLLRILTDAAQAGHGPPAVGGQIPRALRTDLRSVRASLAPALTEHQVAHALSAWTDLVGSINVEIFGQLRNVIQDQQGYFDYQMQAVGQRLGLT
jgi:AcrR family transcriptional regulator